jgi:hypothetical protein
MPLAVNGLQSRLLVPGRRSNDLAAPAIDVRIVTLDSILHSTKVDSIDFISIDVEGYEIDVLRGFSIEKYRPRLLLLEDFADDNARHRYMRDHGYKRVRRTGHNSWYLPDDAAFEISLFGKWCEWLSESV